MLDVAIAAGFAFLAAHTQIEFLDILIGCELVRRAVDHNLAVLHDVTVGGNGQ